MKGHPILPQSQSVGSHRGLGSRTSSSPAQPRGAQPITARPEQLCFSKAALSSSPICCSLAQKQQQGKALGICHPGPLCIQTHPTCLELPLRPEQLQFLKKKKKKKCQKMPLKAALSTSDQAMHQQKLPVVQSTATLP